MLKITNKSEKLFLKYWIRKSKWIEKLNILDLL